MRKSESQEAQWPSVSVARLTGLAVEQSRRIAHRVNHVLAKSALQPGYWGVAEYPRSGGTWLGRMVADALCLPFPQLARAPSLRPCVLHNHWPYDPRLRQMIYIVRDGRDVMVSLYFARMRQLGLELKESGFARHMLRKYRQVFGEGFDRNDVIRNLPMFIELEMTEPRGVRVTWPDHVLGWTRPAVVGTAKVVFVTYEDLVLETGPALTKVLLSATGRDPDPQRLASAVRRHSFARATGRAPGEEDRDSYARKGLAGDWKNHFSRDAAAIFDHFAGEALVQLGYESSRGWVDGVTLTP